MKNRYELTPDGRYAIIYIRCQGYERATIVSVEDLERAKQVPTSWYGDVPQDGPDWSILDDLPF